MKAIDWIKGANDEAAQRLAAWLDAKADSLRDFNDNSPPLWPRILVVIVPTIAFGLIVLALELFL